MPGFAANFVNLMDPSLVLVGPGGTALDSHTARLRAAIAMIERTEPVSRRGVVWFPPGEYQIETGLVIGENITLAFAPGAVLVPIAPPSEIGPPIPASVVIQIRGPIDAERRRIFATAPTWTTPGFGPGVASPTLGRVALTGTQLTQVFPEWWGAEGDWRTADPVVDCVAIEAAFRAAIADREAFTRDAPVPPVSIYFAGTYAIDREIVLPDGLRDVVLEGASTSLESPTIRCVSSSTTAVRRFVFLFRRATSVVIRGLSFDAAGFAWLCLRFDVSLVRDQQEHRILVERCSWANGARGQVAIYDDSDAARSGASLVARFRRCLFAGVSDAMVPALGSTGHVALSSSTPFAATLVVDGCSFTRFALRAIRTAGGRLDVMACHFDLDESPSVFLKLATDIELQPPTVRDAPYGSLNASFCDSVSPTFLRVVPRVDFSLGVTDQASVLLSGVKHRWALAFSYVQTAPAVIWEEPPLGTVVFPPTRDFGGRLNTVGCSFVTRTPEVYQTPPLFDPTEDPRSPHREGPGVQIAPIPRVALSRFVTRVTDAGTFLAGDPNSGYLTFERSRPLSAFPRLLRNSWEVGGLGFAAPTQFLVQEGYVAPSIARALWWATWLRVRPAT